MRIIILILVCLGICFLIPGYSLGDDFYQLLVPSADDLQVLEKLPIQYYGRVQNETEDFLLISIDPLKIDSLKKIPRRKLTTDSAGKTFFWVYPNPKKSLPDPLLSMALARDREGILVDISREEAERLSTEGFSIQLLVPLPISIVTAGPKTLKAVKGGQIALPNPVIHEMMLQVTESNVYTYTGNLTGMWPVTIGESPYTISTRNSYKTDEIQKSGQYLYEFYKKLGLEVSIEEFICWGTLQRNIVAEKKGAVFPERIIALTSHYDDMPNSILAPGADDNASGTVGVMIAAEILSNYDWGRTIRFINFACEEQGLGGSHHHARKSYCIGEDLEAVINMDMIAWNTAGSSPDMDIHVNPMIPASFDLSDLLQDIINGYGLELRPAINKFGSGRGDHASFWNYQFPAIMAIENSNDFNPNYHSSTDTLTNFEDFNYYLEMIKAGIGLVAHLGGLVEEGWGYLGGTVIQAETREPLANVSIATQNPSWGYIFLTTTDEYGRYYQRVVSGSHNVTYKINGYGRETVSDVLVPKNDTLIKDLSLSLGTFYSSIYLPFILEGYSPKTGCP
ncbi:MAG: M28 family peptidase [Deltaproteobacteria bacterium]|nr:M28 family peptidase [Deltaproteobacteria bacterium]